MHSLRIVYISTYTDLVEGWLLVLQLPILFNISPPLQFLHILFSQTIPSSSLDPNYTIHHFEFTNLLILDRCLLCDRHSLNLENIAHIHS